MSQKETMSARNTGRKSTILGTVGNLLLICSVLGLFSAFTSYVEGNMMEAVSWVLSCVLTTAVGAGCRFAAGRKAKQEEEKLKKEDDLMDQFKTLQDRNRRKKK